MTTADLTKAKKIVSRAKKLSDDISTLERTSSCKVIFVLSDGHNLTLYVTDSEVEGITIDLHKMVIEAMKHERQELHKEFEKL